MSEQKNGWYLRSDGYMTSECNYQRIEAMKSSRALDNHQKLVFVEFMGGKETDRRVYVPHPGTCRIESEVWHDHGGYDSDTYEFVLSCGHSVEWLDSEPPCFCPKCGREVKK
jgi:hypothetical protein